MKKSPDNHAILAYIDEWQKIAQQTDKEIPFRTAIHNLLRALSGSGVNVWQELNYNLYGTPDFIVKDIKSGAVVGCVECKKTDKDLDVVQKSEQIKKYVKGFSANILLTNHGEFRLLRDDKLKRQTTLSPSPTDQEKRDLATLLAAFLNAQPRKITVERDLAESLAQWCAWLRESLIKSFSTDEESLLITFFNAFKNKVYKELTKEEFADVLAQTLIYTLLMAKFGDDENKPQKITLGDITKSIPHNFALIREFSKFLSELENGEYQESAWYIAHILDVVNAIDMESFKKSMLYGSGNDKDDPYLLFYEVFLKAYDEEAKIKRGVYYTPPQAVKFIISAADEILRRDFKKKEGLGDKNVRALDFAAGTGTFMLEMFRQVLHGKSALGKDHAKRNHLLTNFYGFELMIAPYVIAHLKLSGYLAQKGVKLSPDKNTKGDYERIPVYLTNSLKYDAERAEREGKNGTPELPGIKTLPAMDEEEKKAYHVKTRKDILVIVGNPPYSGVSQNKGTGYEWISGLIENYKYIDGKHFGERNSKWLQDDYVKFIRMAQWRVDEMGQGIVAIITNHNFLDAPTFRGMRYNLMQTFNRMYFLDLHGSAQKGSDNDDKDENIFNIKQGVCISILIKLPKTKGCQIYRGDLRGTKQFKYEQLENKTVLATGKTVAWKKITAAAPLYMFKKQNAAGQSKYNKLYSITDIFPVNVTGIVTSRDKLCINYTDKELLKAIANFADLSVPAADIKKRYAIKDNYQWKMTEQRNLLSQTRINKKLIHDINYRPFDVRRIYYNDIVVFRKRLKFMRHMLTGDNIALVSVRQSPSSRSWRHCFVTDKIMEACYISNKGSEINYIYPLYIYQADMNGGSRRENIAPEFRQWLNDHYGKKYAPEKIMGYVYAVLHSPDYRAKYAEFLRIGFPRIPFVHSNKEFLRLAKIGENLIAAHLLKIHVRGRAKADGDTATRIITQIKYNPQKERLYYNADEYIGGVSSEVYDFQIGGFQPLMKFLKYRKGRKLTDEEIETLIRATNAIAHTIRQMTKIGNID